MPVKKSSAAELATVFRGNATPAMIEDLAKVLGVSATSLHRLEIGFVPIVPFKSGDNYEGWFTIPERDASGEVIGLGIRNIEGRKAMYPKAGTRGIISSLAIDEEKDAFTPGRHNWHRTKDVGVLCPVCNKPDGCLVHRDNPEDPRAAICIRTPSPANVGLGWLHILKPSGLISSRRDDDSPVIIVEGMTDTAAAMDLGFDAIGKPNDIGGLQYVKDLVRGRHTIVVGENDRKPDGREPGRDGMVATWQAIRGIAKSVRMVMPPEKYKDLRTWKSGENLSGEDFLTYAKENGEDSAEDVMLSSDSPRIVAEAYLRQRFRVRGRYTLRWMNGKFYEYVGNCYRSITEDKLRGPAYDWAKDRMVQKVMDSGEVKLQPLRCDKYTLSNVFDAMSAPELARAEGESPMWINGARGPDPKEIIPFSNGLLHWPSWVLGRPEEEYFMSHTPDFFGTYCLPYEFDPDADCPVFKRAVLEQTLGSDPAKPKLLLQWFGYNMTSDTSLQKVMLLLGSRGTGKSTVSTVLSNLVGEKNVCTPNLMSLGSHFGLEEFEDAHAAIMHDVRFEKASGKTQALENILKISGRDAVSIYKKNTSTTKENRNVRLSARFTIISNSMPELPDHSAAMMRRLLILYFPKTFEAAPDTDLPKKLEEELPGIAVLSMRHLKYLHASRRFAKPRDHDSLMDQWKSITSPIASFVEECAEIGSGYRVSRTDLYECWEAWRKERGITSMSRTLWENRLVQQYPSLSRLTEESGQSMDREYLGIRLTSRSIKLFLR